MDIPSMQWQYIEFLSSLYREGYLDDHYAQLQNLQDNNSPEFVVEVVSLFFQDSEKLLNNLANALQKPIVDYKEVDSHVHRFKGSSASIGANRVKNVCINFRTYCEVNNRDGCVQSLQQLNHEYNVMKSKFATLFGLERQIVAAGGQVPKIS